MNFGVHQTRMRREIVARAHAAFGAGGVYEISIENDQNRILVAVAPSKEETAADAVSCALCAPSALLAKGYYDSCDVVTHL